MLQQARMAFEGVPQGWQSIQRISEAELCRYRYLKFKGKKKDFFIWHHAGGFTGALDGFLGHQKHTQCRRKRLGSKKFVIADEIGPKHAQCLENFRQS